MRPIDLLHLGTERVLCAWEHEGVLIDPGPQSCEAALLAALDAERPRALLLTHVHLDHAGVAGSLVRRWPDLRVHVHARGAPHLADPARLVASVARLYGGEDERARLWGSVEPVPAGNLRVVGDGDRVLEDYLVAHTPGHASHHVCFLHLPSRFALVGDVGGVRIPPAEYVLAPTPPPDVDVEAWERSLDRLLAWAPEGLGLMHWGEVADVAAHLAAVRERLHEQVLLAARHGEEAFVAGLLQRLEAGAGELAPEYVQAISPAHLYQGLARWHGRRE